MTKRIATRLTQIKEEMAEASKLLALVAPVDLNKQKAEKSHTESVTVSQKEDEKDGNT